MIEKIVPVWAKGFDERFRITYDVGLGREFLAHELRADDKERRADGRRRGRRVAHPPRAPQIAGEATAPPPLPGTFPVVVTDKQDWGGWRTPGAEYDRDPVKVEFQAR